MKKFDEMNEAEQKAWWLDLAKVSLDNMRISEAEVTWLAYTYNPVFNVIFEGDEYVLKIYQDRLSGIHEVAVLVNLDKQGISAPKFRRISESLNPHIPLALLMTKVEGTEKTLNLIIPEDIQAIGVFLAKLHQCDEFTLQINSRPKLDYDGLFSNNSLYPLTKSSKALFSPKQINLMDAVALVVKSTMEELGQGESEFGLIHGDLLLKNILFHEGEVRALDFEYCGWGYYLYDLCPLLWQLKPLSHYKELEEALWNGYCSIRPLTERHRQLLETFIAARQVASMRWVAANQHNPAYQGKVESILRQRTAELQGFLETGILTRS